MLEFILIYLVGCVVSYGYYYGSGFMFEATSRKGLVTYSLMMGLFSWVGVFATLIANTICGVPHNFRFK